MRANLRRQEMAVAADNPFGRYWAAATISSFGTAVTTVAMPVLVVQELDASAFSVGVVNAAQFVPYAVLGLVAGVYADRWRRQRILVWSSLGRAATLGAVPVLWAFGALEVWTLVVLLLAFGAFSVFAFAATQSLLPLLVPRIRLVPANARLDQSDAAAQTLGPALGGGLVGLLGAPLAIAVDAVSYLVDAVLNAGLRVDESAAERAVQRHLGREIREGLRWTYRHPTLAPLSVSTHVWFVANAAGFTALTVIALRQMGLSAFVSDCWSRVVGSPASSAQPSRPRSDADSAPDRRSSQRDRSTPLPGSWSPRHPTFPPVWRCLAERSCSRASPWASRTPTTRGIGRSSPLTGCSVGRMPRDARRTARPEHSAPSLAGSR